MNIKKLGNNIVVNRFNKGLSQAELVARTGYLVKQSQISRLEQGLNKHPSLESIVAIAEALEVDIEQLLYDDFFVHREDKSTPKSIFTSTTDRQKIFALRQSKGNIFITGTANVGKSVLASEITGLDYDYVADPNMLNDKEWRGIRRCPGPSEWDLSRVQWPTDTECSLLLDGSDQQDGREWMKLSNYKQTVFTYLWKKQDDVNTIISRFPLLLSVFEHLIIVNRQQEGKSSLQWYQIKPRIAFKPME